MGILYWPCDAIHRPCACYRTDICFRHGLFGLFECRNIPLEWNFGVSKFYANCGMFH